MKQFDYFVSGKDIPGIVYHSKGQYYVDQSVVTLAHFTKIFKGDFHIDPVSHEIREYFDDGSYVVVANSGI